MIITASASRIAKLQNSSMVDECLINTSASSIDSFGQITFVFTSGSTSASSICGFSNNSGNKYFNDTEIIYKSDATIRLPLATSITETNTITLTKQNNSTVNRIYKIVNLSVGHGCLVAKVNKIEV